MKIDRITSHLSTATKLGRAAQAASAVAQTIGWGAAVKALALPSAIPDLTDTIFETAVSKWPSYFCPPLQQLSEGRWQQVGVLSYFVGSVFGVPIVWGGSWPDGRVKTPVPLETVLERFDLAEPLLMTSAPRGMLSLKKVQRGRFDLSAQAKQIVQQTREIPGCRGWLFTGPPGGGKSTLARQVASEVVGSWLEISPAALRDDAGWDLVRLLKPGALVIDDLDAGNSPDLSATLKGLEDAHTFAKVVCVTANTTNKVRGALLRPGRIDEDPVEVRSPSTAIAENIAPHLTPEQVEQATGLLAAYLAELDRRVAVGRDFDTELAGLRERMVTVGDR